MKHGIKKVGQVAFLFVILLVLAYFLIGYWNYYWPPLRLHRTLLYTQGDGICLVDAAGKTTKYALPSGTGRPVEAGNLTFAVIGSTFLYWSPGDHAISVTSATGRKTRWLPILDCGTVKRICGDENELALNCRGDSPNYTRTVSLLDLHTGRCKRLDNVVEARVDPSGSGKIALRLADGSIALSRYIGDGEKRILSKASEIHDWDYDFDAKRLYVLCGDGRHLRVISDSGMCEDITLPGWWAGLRLFWERNTREVWILAGGFIDSCRLLSFSAQGKYLGALEFNEYAIIGSPSVQTAARNIKDLLSSHFHAM